MANTRHCTRLVRRNESLPAALRIYMEPLRNRYGYAQVVLFIRDRVRTFSLGTSQPLLSSYISSRVTPPSRRPTTTELSRVWYGELLLRIYCAIVPSSFFLFSSPPLPFSFSFFDPAYCKILIDGRPFEVLPRGGYFTLGESEKLGNDE